MLLARGGDESGPGTTQTQQNLSILQNKWASLNGKMDDRRVNMWHAIFCFILFTIYHFGITATTASGELLTQVNTITYILQAKLDEAVALATGFQTSLQDTINWLTQAEQTLNMAQPPSLLLDTVLFQIDEHKVLSLLNLCL